VRWIAPGDPVFTLGGERETVTEEAGAAAAVPRVNRPDLLIPLAVNRPVPVKGLVRGRSVRVEDMADGNRQRVHKMNTRHKKEKNH
jgi:hypothetical protein